MLLADVNGFPAGQAWIDFVSKRKERTGVLWAVRVYPFLQGLGIGGRLLAAAERALEMRGLAWSQLGVDRTNEGARRFYARSGYRLVGEERGSYSFTPPGSDRPVEVPRDEVILRKRLLRRRGAPVGAGHTTAKARRA